MNELGFFCINISGYLKGIRYSGIMKFFFINKRLFQILLNNCRNSRIQFVERCVCYFLVPPTVHLKCNYLIDEK